MCWVDYRDGGNRTCTETVSHKTNGLEIPDIISEMVSIAKFILSSAYTLLCLDLF